MIRNIFICLLLVCLIGCKKGTVSVPVPAAATQPAADAPVTEADVLGQWKAAKVDAPIVLADSMQKVMLDAQRTIRADHTYTASSSVGGQVHGTWRLDGKTLALSPEGSPSTEKSTLIVERPHLVDRKMADLAIFYNKVGPAPDTSPKFSMTVTQLRDEIKKNKAAAAAKYDGVYLELTGDVVGINPMPGGPSVTIAGPGSPSNPFMVILGTLHCTALLPEPWADICAGERVKVVGLATIFEDSAEISEARFTLDGPSMLTAVSAEQLAIEYGADATKAPSKYTVASKAKTLILTGKLLAKHVEPGKTSTLELGTDDHRVLCEYSINSDATGILTPLQSGQIVKLAGQLDLNSQSPKLTNCLLITK